MSVITWTGQSLHSRRSGRSLRYYRHHTDLDIHILWKRLYGIGFPRREITGEISAIDFIDGAKKRHVAKQDRRFYHVPKLEPRSRKNGPQVLHDLMRFARDVRRIYVPRCRVERDLT